MKCQKTTEKTTKKTDFSQKSKELSAIEIVACLKNECRKLQLLLTSRGSISFFIHAGSVSTKKVRKVLYSGKNF